MLPAYDGLIAATALAHGLIVATRNSEDFRRAGVQVINPWKERP
jgi:toxin FitB